MNDDSLVTQSPFPPTEWFVSWHPVYRLTDQIQMEHQSSFRSSTRIQPLPFFIACANDKLPLHMMVYLALGHIPIHFPYPNETKAKQSFSP